ncbi:GNAT family N-acetyltransferase [Tessaracoccus oleiagri]|uniref:Protein N-acetyltransferase, RimJ/RimL family n=1 Tax=Tessaracoccus oleiagri TaxID=686624 RepID=A0A1G9JTK6_9ACTN|nr:GNAT family N-acetyltransferase [Tessaracoccus oleiagri]SDL40213.1 Protein N-acetyltransferase, RimJ/RimL family [Tessaracoccus oleiagri]
MIPLRTERLNLRAFDEGDLRFVFRVHQHPDLARFIPSAVTPDEATARRHLERFMTLAEHPVQGFTVAELRDAVDGRAAGTPVGLIMVKPIPPSGGGEAVDLEIGWRQAPEHCGHGYITEAAGAVLDAVLGAGVDEVVAVAHPDNFPSHAVAERIGMDRVGLTRAYYDTETLLFRRRRAGEGPFPPRG